MRFNATKLVPVLSMMACLSIQEAVAGEYRDATAQLGPQNESLFTMDVAQGDVDGDGYIDLVLAIEFRPNILLLNQGDGTFRPEPHALPAVDRDSEDAVLADFDADGDLDLIVVTEDDHVNEYHLNDGAGRFYSAPQGFPVTGISNAVEAADLDGDGDIDVLIGNNGPNVLLLNDGSGAFSVESSFPGQKDITQDLAIGDIDGDGLADIVAGNEGRNRVLMQVAPGQFEDQTADRLPGTWRPGETRDVELIDLTGDGVLDLHVANVDLFRGMPPQNKVLVNDGTGRFTDQTDERLPAHDGSTMDAAFADLDGDGDPDMVLAEFGDVSGQTWTTPYRVLINDGTGRFTWPDPPVLPTGTTGNGLHVEVINLPGTTRPALFLGSRGGPDRMLMPVP